MRDDDVSARGRHDEDDDDDDGDGNDDQSPSIRNVPSSLSVLGPTDGRYRGMLQIDGAGEYGQERQAGRGKITCSENAYYRSDGW